MERRSICKCRRNALGYAVLPNRCAMLAQHRWLNQSEVPVFSLVYLTAREKPAPTPLMFAPSFGFKDCSDDSPLLVRSALCWRSL